MTWLFSKAMMERYGNSHCSQEPGEESLEGNCSDGEPYAQLNVKPTPHKFWRNDKMMDHSNLSRFGLTLRLLTDDHGEAVLMSFLEDFPVRTYPQPGEVQGLPGRGQDSGLSSLESLAKYNPDTCSWKTPQYSLLGGLVPFSETWPRWGTMQNGACWVRPMWERRTNGTESGLWPTPNVPNGGRSVSHVTEWSESGRTAYHKGKKVQVGLESAVKMWPTPQASDNRDRGNMSDESIQRRIRMGKQIGLSKAVKPEKASGSLNPTWVEWLMGWPIGWTDLKPLETGRFQQWQQQHSDF